MCIYHGTSIEPIKAIIETGMIKEMAENTGDPTASAKYSANAPGIGIYFAHYLDYSINSGYARPTYEKKNKNGEWIQATHHKDAMRERKCKKLCTDVSNYNGNFSDLFGCSAINSWIINEFSSTIQLFLQCCCS